MAVKSVLYLANLVSNTERGPSESIWGAPGSPNAWIEDFLQDPRLGQYFFDEFNSAGLSPAAGSAANFGADANWYAYLDTNGAITDSGILGGGIHLAASTTAHQGVALGQLTNAFQIINSTPVYQPRLAFEARVAMSTAALVASTADMFVGLIDASGTPASVVPITATGGTLATAPGFIGFHKRGGATNGTDWNFVYNVAGGTPVYATNLQNLVTTVTGSAPVGGTYYKLGFAYNPQATTMMITSASTGQTAGVIARPEIIVYVNGFPAVAFLTTTNIGGAAFPVTLMAPSIAFKQQSTTAAVSADVDWIRVAQQFTA